MLPFIVQHYPQLFDTSPCQPPQLSATPLETPQLGVPCQPLGITSCEPLQLGTTHCQRLDSDDGNLTGEQTIREEATERSKLQSMYGNCLIFKCSYSLTIQ